MTTYVYQAARENDRGDYTKGYIGVSIDPERRKAEHIKYDKNGNVHLRRALDKYCDVEWNIIFEGSDEECYALEKELRPRPNMGWNVAAGGGRPPVNKMFGEDNPMFGKTFTEEHKRMISDSNKGKVRTAEHKENYKKAVAKRPASHYDVHKGKGNVNWKGYVHTDNGVFETPKEAAIEFGIGVAAVYRRIKNDNFTNWYYKQER